MPKRIASTSGLHARPATVFVEAAAAYEDLEITIGREEEPADEAMDASSVLALMSLGLEHGDRVALRSEIAALSRHWTSSSGCSKQTTAPKTLLVPRA